MKDGSSAYPVHDKCTSRESLNAFFAFTMLLDELVKELFYKSDLTKEKSICSDPRDVNTTDFISAL